MSHAANAPGAQSPPGSIGDSVAQLGVAIFASSFYPHLGGVEELVGQLARRYDERGYPTIVLTNRWPRHLPEEENVDGVRVYRFPMRTPGSGWRSLLTYVATSWRVTRKVNSFVSNERVGLVHVQCAGPNGLYALRAARKLSLPLVLTTQGEITMDSSRLYQRSRFANSYLRRLCERARVVTAVSAKTAQDLISQVGFRPSDLRVIPNGTDVKVFGSAAPRVHARPYISAVGRLVGQKGFDILIRSFGQAELPDLDLLIAGDGPQRDELAGLIEVLDLVGRVHLVGRLDRLGVAELHAGAEFFVLPSVADEGLPLACVEALAAGVPIVASRSGGIEELVDHGVEGLLVDMGNVDELTAALRTLSSDRELRSHMSSVARMRAAKLDWDVIVEEYLDVFAAAILG